MKRKTRMLILLGLVISLLVLGTSLGLVNREAASPGDTVQKLYSHLEEGDADKAISLFSQDLIDYLGMEKLETVIQRATRKVDAKGGIKSFSVENEEMHGHAAIVRAAVEYGNGEKRSGTAKLVNEGGAWKLVASNWL